MRGVVGEAAPAPDREAGAVLLDFQGTGASDVGRDHELDRSIEDISRRTLRTLEEDDFVSRTSCGPPPGVTATPQPRRALRA